MNLMGLFRSPQNELEKGGKYFVMRNHSAIIGFSIPVNDCRRYHIIASHSLSLIHI